jgi:maltose alpha-D-glucosyltransferase/alpha-amylase
MVRSNEKTWYKDAVFYQVNVRAFNDSNHDGHGDFRGLIQRLDHLEALGVNALWLMPFFPSPGRDDGYDIADYCDVDSSYGTLTDFQDFMTAAHSRGIRVIIELVINHTSDQHRWFQQAIHAPKDSSPRNLYVWSDNPDQYKDARIIFNDSEPSNWTWDPIAQQYFWHRFYRHQPDLNFDNPEVHKRVFEIAKFWLDKGVDGLRLDAIPYLYERNGTSCENEPETHEFLKKLRGFVDQNYENRMLLAEANMWPEEAVKYFGDGDECQMAFHFPLMPRLYLAVERGERFPLLDAIQDIPATPVDCQWALFLRNHDELTLEMVSYPERAFLYRTLADDPLARINLGIRRRLAPLMHNDGGKIRLLNALLFSLPGTPVIYYGDEIGMGDNIYLGDRNAVRTPMQWLSDRNAGFSTANPQSLFLPVITDPEYSAPAVNVHMQSESPSSLLTWMKRIIALRKSTDVFGRGSLEVVSTMNHRVLAFTRVLGEDCYLIVANLSRQATSAHLDLSQWAGRTPVELFGGSKFPTIETGSYPISFAPHGFYWFQLVASGSADAHATDQIPTISIDSLSDLSGSRLRRELCEFVPRYLSSRPWFWGGGREFNDLEILDLVPAPWAVGDEKILYVLFKVPYRDGSIGQYMVTVSIVPPDAAQAAAAQDPARAIAWIQTEAGTSLLQGGARDALLTDQLTAEGVVGSGVIGGNSNIQLHLVRSLPETVGSTHRKLFADHDGPTVLVGHDLVWRFYPRLDSGVDAAVKVSELLGNPATQVAAGPHVEFVYAHISYERPNTEPRVFGILTERVKNEGNLADVVRPRLDAWLDTREAAPRAADSSIVPMAEHTVHEVEASASAQARAGLGGVVELAEHCGRATAQLHMALAEVAPTLKVPSFTQSNQRAVWQEMVTTCRRTLEAIEESRSDLADGDQACIDRLLGGDEWIQSQFSEFRNAPLEFTRSPRHGDLALERVLVVPPEMVFVGFRDPVANIDLSPLWDVGEWLASLASVVTASRLDALRESPGDQESRQVLIAQRSIYAQEQIGQTFLRSYYSDIRDEDFIPKSKAEQGLLIRCIQITTTLRQLGHALRHQKSAVRTALYTAADLVPE